MDVKKTVRFLFRYNLLYLVIGIMLLPGLIAIYMGLFGSHHTFKWAKGNYRLYGVTDTVETPTWDWQHVRSHEVQKYIETVSAERLPLRSWLIRTINQFYFTLFKKSYAYNNSILVGKKNHLFEKYYIYSYCGLITPIYDDPVKLTAWADKLQQLDHFFEKRGKLFLYIITPNKALYEPEDIPDRYHCKDHETQHIRMLTKLLDERHVFYVNGLDVIHSEGPSYSIALFPQGGIHWNQLGAALFASQMVKTIDQIHPNELQPIAFDYKSTMKPHGTDHDLTSLMNLLKPNKHFITPVISYHPNPKPYPSVHLSLIGGSFNNQLLDVFHENKTFEKMDFYFYFKVGNLFYNKDNVMSKDALDATTLAVIKDIVSSDIVILEENASNTISNHGDLFYQTLFSYYKT